jgi:hypothetical protein
MPVTRARCFEITMSSGFDRIRWTTRKRRLNQSENTSGKSASWSYISLKPTAW